jgi:hypothetical protein
MMCVKGIRLCVQHMITIIDSIVNIIGGTYQWAINEWGELATSYKPTNFFSSKLAVHNQNFEK